MKTKYQLLLATLIAILTVFILGQEFRIKTYNVKDENNISGFLDKMKGKNPESSNESILTGKYIFLFDMKNGKEVSGTSTDLKVFSLSKQTFSVFQQPLPDYLNGGVLHYEKGDYLVSKNLSASVDNKTSPLKIK